MAAATSARKAPRFEAVHADASEQIAHEIRMYIERGGLQPGDRIGTEHELAREFGVSRPTLREGLRRLAGSHLIRVQKGRAGGVFVENTPKAGIGRHVSESIAAMLESESVTLYELLEARMFLEVPLAGMAAERVGRGDDRGTRRRDRRTRSDATRPATSSVSPTRAFTRRSRSPPATTCWSRSPAGSSTCSSRR